MRGSEAGAIAGVVGGATFLMLHSAWIVPIWQVGPVALLVGAGAGAAVGNVVMDAGADRAWPAEVVGLVAGCWVILAPSIAIAELGIRAGAAPLLAVLTGFVAPPLAVGAFVGWRLGGTRPAAIRGAGAAALLAVGPGHNVPMLAATRAVPLELAILASVFAASSIVFVACRRRSWVREPQSVGEPTR